MHEPHRAPATLAPVQGPDATQSGHLCGRGESTNDVAAGRNPLQFHWELLTLPPHE